MKQSSIHHLIKTQARRTPHAIAISAPGRRALSYQRLSARISDVVMLLNAMGVGRNDRVALVLPNGPEMAVAFIAVASCATSAPLNPNYRAREFDFYLSDLNARALIVQAGVDSEAIEVAMSQGIPIIELVPELHAEAGMFILRGEFQGGPLRGGFAKQDDVALVLHTSGTTSRPKIVPLTQENLCASARNIRETLQLTANDRCLNIMPLYHIHGLMGATLSSLSAGASVVCTPGFYAPKFFAWMEECQPTWYSAVPTMHQSILARAGQQRDVIAQRPLRFIRSSSASLPPQVMAELEETFDAPVIESYGMTEAAHQMTSNPLPHGERKPGSVGIAAGPEVAIMDKDGNLLEANAVGEIVIRGDSVTHGYENNAAANESAFTAGWLRSGDQGYMDDDGYFYITGRLKELINRGGEKISPREIDEVLLDHVAVAQVVTFALPDPNLGEDIAAAVVLRENTNATEQELREFVAERLADFKVPRKIVFLDEIPKGPTGKLQRIGLADKLGLTSEQPTMQAPLDKTAARTPTEEFLVEIWDDVLGLRSIGIHNRFLDLGGDSMLATQLVARVSQALQFEVSLIKFFEAPTIAKQAVVLEGMLTLEIEELSEKSTQNLAA